MTAVGRIQCLTKHLCLYTRHIDTLVGACHLTISLSLGKRRRGWGAAHLPHRPPTWAPSNKQPLHFRIFNQLSIKMQNCRISQAGGRAPTAILPSAPRRSVASHKNTLEGGFCGIRSAKKLAKARRPAIGALQAP